MVANDLDDHVAKATMRATAFPTISRTIAKTTGHVTPLRLSTFTEVVNEEPQSGKQTFSKALHCCDPLDFGKQP